MRIEAPRQSAGKRAAKIFLPVLIGLNVPFLGIEIDSLANPIDLDKAGKGAMLGSQLFDYLLLPGLFFILLIVQWLFILPMWNRMVTKYRRVFLSSLSIGIIISVLIGALLGYLVCANQLDQDKLINSIIIMNGFVIVYCILNIITLYLLDRSYIKYLKPHKLKIS
jgi:hypothetical protein